MPKRHYSVYCDESAKTGPHYSNFYAGVLVSSADREAIENALRAKKEEQNLFGEVKWTKVTENYLEKYIEFVREYFSYITTSRLRVRVMFTHNYHKPIGLSEQHLEDRYFLLYYQLLKHAFGFKYCNPNRLDRVFISVLLDDLPDTREKAEKFKSHISQLSNTADYRDSQIYFPANQIAEVNSDDHCILQGLDILLGAMQFRLNDMHKLKPEGSLRRGKRTVAKEKLFKEISRLIRQDYPNFNIGNSTGTPNGLVDRWSHPYRHWLFMPNSREINRDAAKVRAPHRPT